MHPESRLKAVNGAREHSPEHEAGRGGEGVRIVAVVARCLVATTAATSGGRSHDRMNARVRTLLLRAGATELQCTRVMRVASAPT